MTTGELMNLTLEHLPFEPNADQFKLIAALSAFILAKGPDDVFLLNGYAGTGKTSVISAFVNALKEINKKTIILAPTGRAAKVASNFSGHKSFTIHKRIFRGDSFNPANDRFFLAENRDKDTLFIIDEASLITDSQDPNHSLLCQLIRHVRSAPGCTMLFLGDIAQLPPVGQVQSAAMSPERLKSLGLNPVSFSLTKPVRHTIKSGILYNATNIRNHIFSTDEKLKFYLYKGNFKDVEIVSSNELADYLSDSWANVGKEETLIITRSNKRANNFNRAIRTQVMFSEEVIEPGERLVISKNDYYWSKKNQLESFLANGETVIVNWIGKKEKAYGRWFLEVELKIPDIETPIAAKLMLRSLVAEGPSIDRQEMESFYNRVLANAEGELSHKIKAALEDPYYNALQVKYAYCVTCHKAQGGQWKHVYIDMSAIDPQNMNEDFYRWLYTAITRSSEKIFFINPTIPVK